MSSNLGLVLRASVENGLRRVSVEFAHDVIRELSDNGALNCSMEAALKMFNFDDLSVVTSRSKASKAREERKPKAKKAKVTAKPSVILPFCGKIQEDWCKGVKFNHGLHTQCTNGSRANDRYCSTCRKHADNSSTGKPVYGDIEERAKYNVDYRDPKGKLTTPYANVVEKLGINMIAAETAATTLGWTIPECQKVKREPKRGRPSKSAAVSDTDSESNETPKKAKKKGRPAKAKKTPVTQEDQIAALVAEAQNEIVVVDSTSSKKEDAAKLKAEKKALKAAEKLAKKEAAAKLKAEKKAEKEAAKLAKKEAAEKLKAEKKAEKEAAKLAKKEAAAKLKADKLAAKKLEKEQKVAAKKLEKEQKVAAKKTAKAAKKTAKAEKKALKQAEELAKKEAISAPQLVEEVIEEDEEDPWIEAPTVNAGETHDDTKGLEIPPIDDEEEADEGIELSEKMTVGGVEYYHSTSEDGNVILFSLTGEPVGIYDKETDTVQEAEFDCDSDCESDRDE